MFAAVVVPSNRPKHIAAFVDVWAPQLNRPDARLLVVEDFPHLQGRLPAWVEHYCHADIDAMGESGNCIPRYSDGVRDFGFWKAAQDKDLDMIVSLDDDVTPVEGVDLLAEHWRQLETPRHMRWWPTADIRTRGYPYSLEGVKPVLNHGLWRGMPDLDAVEQLHHPEMAWKPPPGNSLVPPHMYFTMCAMNFAFRPSVAPFMFFPPLPEGMKQFGDIWAGIIFKRIIDSAGWAVSSGEPIVRHDRASILLSNLRGQMLGYGVNEMLWQVVDEVSIHDRIPQSLYANIATAIERDFPQLSKACEAMRGWARLWEWRFPTILGRP